MKHIIYISALFASVFVVNAQQAQVNKADTKYENFQFIDAIETYERVANKGYRTVDMLEKLGNAYYFNAKYQEAAKWYSQLFSMQPIANDPEYYYRYAQSLKSIGEYEQANTYLEKFYKIKGDDHRVKLIKSDRNYLDIIEENSGRFEIENAGDLNSELSDYGTTIYNGQIIFASTRTSGKVAPKKIGWNNQPFSVLYTAGFNEQGKAFEGNSFSDELDSKYNESTPVFTTDGNTVYFTRNNYLKKIGYDQNRTTLLKIYRATKDDKGKWKNIEELPFNSNNYSVAHPALSPDNKYLYFASDMPGTMGDADIWKVEIKSDGTFGEPINLGPTVNTEARESFPFISSDNQLYYASTGKLGLGGLDVFVSKIEEGKYQEAVNVGKPINGPMDDFAFYFDPEKRSGYFSSNREGGVGDDDIYKFVELRKLECDHLLNGVITDLDTKLPIAGAKVTLYDAENKVLATTTTDSQGRYSFDKNYIKCDHPFRVRAEKENYSVEEGSIKIPNAPGESQLNLALDLVKEPLVPGSDLAKVLNIPIIYFDLDKWNIRPDASVELYKVLQVLEDYPKMKLDIRSHTDSRQTHAYNERLSDRRAKSTRDWLIKKGIAPSRLTARGYGETQLVNGCSDGVDCTEEEHQLNRRSQFIIVSMGE